MGKKLRAVFVVVCIVFCKSFAESFIEEPVQKKKKSETLHRKKEKSIEVREQFCHLFNETIRRGSRIDDMCMEHIRDFAEGQKKSIDGLIAQDLDADYESFLELNQQLIRINEELKDTYNRLCALSKPPK
ncbi:MAG: hypothetical protein WA432_03880 [Candidatus Babeliaceae bacterium]